MPTPPNRGPCDRVELQIKRKPAVGISDKRAPRFEQLGRQLDSSHTAQRNHAQPDDAGEDDLAYFTARPEARTRIRAAFDGEFPRKILKQGAGRQAFVIVAVDRDAAGNPTTRGRGVFFAEGGRA